ncbi:hypothetical protein HY041_01940 [Candidatus Roizmanbacteria bacterium]|nr:hypothetical protein [Candidatus Roizmanbacteria bacterium]
MTDRFNLAYEAHDLHLFENQPDALKDLLLGKNYQKELLAKIGRALVKTQKLQENNLD